MLRAVIVAVATAALFTGGIADAKPRGNVLALTTAPDGGWTQVIEPRAVHRDGITYFGFIDGDDGHIKVGALDHSDDSVTVVNVGTAPAPIVVDLHNAPVIHIRSSDDRLIVLWSGHNSSTLYQRISTDPLDITSWGTTVDIDSSVGGTAYTYPSIVEEDDGTLHLFIRGTTVETSSTLRWAKSTNGGATWVSQGALFSDPSFAYWVVDCDGSRIDIAISDGNPAVDSSSKVYHLYIDGDDDRYAADGTQITASLPLTVSDLPVVYDSADGPGWPNAILAGEQPEFVMALDRGDDWAYRWSKWTGSAWTTEDVASAGQDAPSNATIVAPGVVYATVKVGSRQEIHRHDRELGWLARPVTAGSAADNIYPARIHDPPTDRLIVWLYGTFTTATNNSLAVKAGR